MENYEGWKEGELKGYRDRLEKKSGCSWVIVKVYESKKGYDRALLETEARHMSRRLWWDGIRWRWDGQRSRKGE